MIVAPGWSGHNATVVSVAKLAEEPVHVLQLVRPDMQFQPVSMEEGERVSFVYGDHQVDVGTSPLAVPAFATQAEADAWLESNAGLDLGVTMGWRLP